MSTRERINSMIDEFSDEQLDDLLIMLMGLKKMLGAEMEDDAYCQKLLDDYLNDDSPDKHESITLDDFADELGINLNEL